MKENKMAKLIKERLQERGVTIEDFVNEVSGALSGNATVEEFDASSRELGKYSTDAGSAFESTITTIRVQNYGIVPDALDLINLGNLSKISGLSKKILTICALDGTDSIYEELPHSKENKPLFEEIIEYGKKHSGVRKEGKEALIELLEKGKEEKHGLRNVTYDGLELGLGLGKNGLEKFKGKGFEPDSPSPDTVLKSWVEGYKKESNNTSSEIAK